MALAAAHRRRVLARLVDEHGMVELTYSLVRDYVAKRRPQIQAAAGNATGNAFVPQTHEPEAEVDFGDVWLHSDGEPTKCDGPPQGIRPCRPTAGRCPLSPSTTSCWCARQPPRPKTPDEPQHHHSRNDGDE